MDRTALTAAIYRARLDTGTTWRQLAELIDRPVVWTTAALLGEHPLSRAEAEVLLEHLGLPADDAVVLTTVPVRGGGEPSRPTDPTIYRFHEALLVYGPALKELIHEEFGDGIMSAINFSLDVRRAPHDGGDRVVITMDGKFLPYDWVESAS